MKRLIVLLVILLGLMLLVACEGEKIEIAWAQNTFFSLEKQKNGYYQLWFTDDDVVSYCTDDQELVKDGIWLSDNAPSEIIRVYYEGIFKDDPMYEKWYESSDSGCGSFGSSSDGGGTDPVRMIHICVVDPDPDKLEEIPERYLCENKPQWLTEIIKTQFLPSAQ